MNVGNLNNLNFVTKYSVVDLIKSLEKHLNNHKEEYAKAEVVYKNDVNNSLKQISKVSKKLAIEGSTELNELSLLYNKLNTLKRPIDASKNYEDAISLFSRSTETEISLTNTDANAIFNDQWSWAVDAKFLNASYSSRY